MRSNDPPIPGLDGFDSSEFLTDSNVAWSFWQLGEHGLDHGLFGHYPFDELMRTPSATMLTHYSARHTIAWGQYSRKRVVHRPIASLLTTVALLVQPLAAWCWCACELCPPDRSSSADSSNCHCSHQERLAYSPWNHCQEDCHGAQGHSGQCGCHTVRVTELASESATSGELRDLCDDSGATGDICDSCPTRAPSWSADHRPIGLSRQVWNCVWLI